jgi:hypothetical protein
VAVKGSSLPEEKHGFRIERIPSFYANFRRNRWHPSIEYWSYPKSGGAGSNFKKPLLFASVIDEPNGLLTVLSKINASSIASRPDLSSTVCLSLRMVDMGGLNEPSFP